jgi:hypothetical protein
VSVLRLDSLSTAPLRFTQAWKRFPSRFLPTIARPSRLQEADRHGGHHPLAVALVAFCARSVCARSVRQLSMPRAGRCSSCASFERYPPKGLCSSQMTLVEISECITQVEYTRRAPFIVRHLLRPELHNSCRTQESPGVSMMTVDIKRQVGVFKLLTRVHGSWALRQGRPSRLARKSGA